MDDDLNIPMALAALYEAVRAGNSALDSSEYAAAGVHIVAVRSMLAVLGIDPLAPEWAEQGANPAEHQALDSLIQALIAERNEARGNKDFARADAIRNQLTQAGIALSDSTASTHWSVNG
jgi:cysteinyl-tRNA synthetase